MYQVEQQEISVLEERQFHNHRDIPKTSYDAISAFSEGVYAYQFHTLYAKPTWMDTRAGLDGYLYALDISGKQGPWGLKDSEDRPVIMTVHEEFAIDMIDDAERTSYMVTAGKKPIEGTQAWIGYGTHHRSNQVPDYFDGAVFFALKTPCTAAIMKRIQSALKRPPRVNSSLKSMMAIPTTIRDSSPFG